MKTEVLRLEKVTTKKGERTELDACSLRIAEGSVTGLLAVNTYGLESLLDILLFNLPVYYGHVYYCEKCINSWKEEKRMRNPVTLIDSKSALAEGMSVLDNLCVFRPGKEELIRKKAFLEMTEPYLEDLDSERFGLRIPLESPAEKLDPLQSVVTQILRAVMLGHRLIILREISSLLSEEQMEVLSGVIRHYADHGFAFLYISMHFEEIRSMCTRAAIFNNGTVEMTADLGDEEQRGSLDAAIYHVYAKSFYRNVSGAMSGEERPEEQKPLLTIRAQALPLEVSLHKGECVTLQFLDTKPYQKLVRALSRPLEEDAVEFDFVEEDAGESRKRRPDPDRLRRVAVFSENAPETMIFPEMSVMDNLCMNMDHAFPQIWRNRRMRAMMKEEYIRITGRDIFGRSAGELTREEATELIYMRILMQRPKVMIAAQPFKGADVSLRQKIWKLIGRIRAEGTAVLILTVSMSDALTLADRVIRIGPGAESAEYKKGAFSELPPSMPWTSFYRTRS